MSRNDAVRMWPAVLLAAIVPAASLPGCYMSWSFDETYDAEIDAGADTGMDADAADTTDPSPDTTDAHVDSMDVPVDTADAPPDSPLVCPPPAGDGSWLSFTTSGTTLSSTAEVPCRVETVGTDPTGTWSIALLCGTGAAMTTENVTVNANPLITPMIFEGNEVILRFTRETGWYYNEWFTIRGPGGNLLLAVVAATQVAPWGWDAGDWYDPFSVYVVGGVCPPEETSCGTLERRALEVHSGGDTGRIYDGYAGYVGSTMPVYVHVATAYSYLEMGCDDAPDSYYVALFVPMYP